MDLLKTSEIYTSNQESEFDLLIASSSYESRCKFISKRFHTSSARKVVFGYLEESDNDWRISNDVFFKVRDFDYIQISLSEFELIHDYLISFFDNINRNNIRILVDYTCFSKAWLAGVISFLNQYKTKSDLIIEVIFAYAPSLFVPPPSEGMVNSRHLQPLNGFFSLDLPQKPTSLIIGLGYIPELTTGLWEYFDSEPYVFYTDNSYNPEYHKHVLETNKNILDEIDISKQYQYPLKKTSKLEFSLSNLVKDLLEDTRVIIVPCGPKPFTLISLLMASYFEYVDIWRVSTTISNVRDIKESGHILLHKAVYGVRDNTEIKGSSIRNFKT